MCDAPHYMIGMHWIWWLVWVAVIAVAWWTLARRPAPTAEPTPLERLQRRYADGEITTEVYEEQKTTLLRDR